MPNFMPILQKIANYCYLKGFFGIIKVVFYNKRRQTMAKRIENPADLAFHKEAFEYAKKQIKQGNVNCDEHNWAENQPTPQSEDIYLADHSVYDYGQWFLGTKADTPKDAKEHFEFPIGNFNKVYRSGIIAAKHRAAQFKHHEIEEAAAELLDLIDSTACKA
jgi:hypothetical protein